MISCEKNHNNNDDVNKVRGLAAVKTSEVKDITSISVVSGGAVTSDGGYSVTSRGVVWSTSQEPDLSDNISINGAGTGGFVSEIKGLNPDTKYYIRAFASNVKGTAYGNTITFTTYKEACYDMEYFIDSRDNNKYKTVQIGEQCWFAENLKYSTKTGVYCYNYELDFCDIYGKLYSWQSALKACPEGWRLPSDEDWTKLTDYLGGESIVGDKLKQSGIDYWYSPNDGATNETGFSALPGGFRRTDSVFTLIGQVGAWWTSTQIENSGAWNRQMSYDKSDVKRFNRPKEMHFSVRCLRNYPVK